MISSIQADLDCGGAPTNSDERPSPFRDSLRFRNGSLPLKKRRLNYNSFPLWELQVNNSSNNKIQQLGLAPSVSSSNSSSTTTADQKMMSRNSTASNTTICSDDEKFAVLALVAAAATTAAGHAATVAEPPASCYSTTARNVHSEAPEEDKVQSSKQRRPLLLKLSPSSSSNLPMENHSSKNIILSKSDNKEATPRTSTSGRIHHPPLAAPLPNGCHGRTSRNNSYCRRQPCYNGSKYCKLHYQHYVIAGIRPIDDSDTNPSSSLSVEGNSSSTPTNGLAMTQLPATTTTTITTSGGGQPSAQQQDKRFTGCDDEVRCEATTTRGRACAYVAVHGTKYCYLHADYDINPPPRRGGGGNSSSSTGSTGSSVPNGGRSKLVSPNSSKRVTIVGTDRLAAIHPQEIMDVVAPSLEKTTMYSSSSSPPSVTSEESCVSSLSQQEQLQYHQPVVAMEDAQVGTVTTRTTSGPFPLLSSISPDQWYGKMVRIATGPLAGRNGIVEKWGNGWVGVRVVSMGGTAAAAAGGGSMSDPHLHNRRALELYLLPEENEAKATTTTTTNHNDTLHSDGETLQMEMQDNSSGNNNGMLRRCVSRENDTPESKDSRGPTKDEENDDMRYTSEDSRSRSTSPCFPNDEKIASQVVMKLDNDNNRCVDGIYQHLQQQRGTMVPESPVTPANGMSSVVDFSVANFHFIPSRSCEESNLECPDAIANTEGQGLDNVRCDEEEHHTTNHNNNSSFPPTAVTVTPKPIVSPRKIHMDDEMPLVQSLWMAQEGLARKSSLDLLFGTAALERSRRTVIKPQRYEDKAMLIRKRGGSGNTTYSNPPPEEQELDCPSSSPSIKHTVAAPPPPPPAAAP